MPPRIIRFAVATFAIVLAGHAAQAQFIDQANDVTPQIGNNLDFFSPIGQEFVPLFDQLNVVHMRVQDAGSDIGPGANMFVRIRENTIGGAILGSSSNTFVPDGFSGYAVFSFPTTVGLVPRDRYVIEVVKTSVGPGTGNYVLTAFNGNSYLNGSAVRSGAVHTPIDYLFREGVTSFTELSIAPKVYGNVTNGTEVGLPPFDAPFIRRTESDDQRGLIEYDLSQFSENSFATAVLHGTIQVNNSLDTGPRTIRIEAYTGDGVIGVGDFDIGSSLLGDATYHPPTDDSVPFSFDVTAFLKTMLAGPANHFGVRFSGFNLQAPSVLSANDLPLLTLTVPEPSTMVLSAMSAVALMIVALRRRRVRGR